MAEDTVLRHAIAPTPTPILPAGTATTLSSLEQLAIRGLLDADDRAMKTVFAQVESWATELQGLHRDEARIALIARALAASRVRCILLETKRDELLTRRDHKGVALIEGTLAREYQRFLALVAEHRLSCTTGLRSVNVNVGRADNVAVLATGGR